MRIFDGVTLVVFISILLGFIWPTPGLLLKPLLMYLLIIMMFFSCLKINLKELREVPKNWWRYLILMLIIFVVPPSIIYLFHSWLQDMILVGLIVTAAMPAGIAIVFLSDLIGGESVKALVATTLAHILSPLVVPMITWFFVHEIVRIPFLDMVLLISELVVIPLLLAQLVRLSRWSKQIAKAGTRLNLVLLFLLIWSSIALARSSILSHLGQFIIASAIVSVVFILVILFSAWFGRNKKERITWAVATTYKNFTLATVVIVTMFGPLAMVGAAVYDILDNLLLIPIKWWAARSNHHK